MFPVKQTVIYTFFCHKGSKSFQNIAFDSVFVMFPVKHTVILHVFCYNVSPKHLFLQCFQCSGIQKPCKILLCTMFFFHFWPFFHCRKATKMTQNSISIPSCAQTPKNPRKMSKTPPYSGLGAKPFLAPPPAKADIATAILTNVIEHLVLLFCPPISTPSPPKRCGRIWPYSVWISHEFLHVYLLQQFGRQVLQPQLGFVQKQADPLVVYLFPSLNIRFLLESLGWFKHFLLSRQHYSWSMRFGDYPPKIRHWVRWFPIIAPNL